MPLLEGPFVIRNLIHLFNSALTIEGHGTHWSGCVLALVIAGAMPSAEFTAPHVDLGAADVGLRHLGDDTARRRRLHLV